MLKTLYPVLHSLLQDLAWQFPRLVAGSRVGCVDLSVGTTVCILYYTHGCVNYTLYSRPVCWLYARPSRPTPRYHGGSLEDVLF